jgi:hypothetical protein
VALLDRGERLQLLGTDGLEFRYGISPEWLPAPSSVGLPRGEATTVEFRAPSRPEATVQLSLAPLLAEADIEVGPPRAVWPGPPVEVRVALRDGAGQLLSPADGFRTSVRIDDQPVRVVWRDSPEGQRAAVPAPSGPGPWVVRVVVTDKRGAEVARGFLEVAPAPPPPADD